MKAGQNLVEKLSLWQLAVIIFSFEVGSTVVVGIGNDAKQDAWIAVAIAMVLGAGLITFYIFMLRKLPGKNLFEILSFCFGKWLGRLIGFFYILYFFYIAARVLRDFCELIITTIFVKTPIEVIAFSIMFVLVYVFYLGIEVFGRTTEVFIPYVFSFILLIGLAIYLSGEMEFKNLQPILPEGAGPVLKAVFPGLLTFPFGETITFMVIIPYVSRIEKSGKVSVLAVLGSGIIIIYSIVIQIATLGVSTKGRENFPLLLAAREISLMEFIERVDLVIVFIVMLGIIAKVGVFFYGGLKGLEFLIQKPYRLVIFPVGMIIAYCATQISSNYAEHILEGLEIITKYMHPIFQFVFPFLLAPVLLWKNKKNAQENGNE